MKGFAAFYSKAGRPLNILERRSRMNQPFLQKLSDSLGRSHHEKVLKRTNELLSSVKTGSLKERIRTDDLSGFSLEVASFFNQLMDEFEQKTTLLGNYLRDLSRGNFNPECSGDCGGEFGKYKGYADELVSHLTHLYREEEKLSAAVSAGRLDEKADPGRLPGNFGKMAEELNYYTSVITRYLDEIPVPFVVMDKNFNVRFINKLGTKILSASKDSIKGQKCYDLFKAGDCHTKNCACSRAMTSGRTETSETDAHPNGLDLAITYSGVPLKDKKGEVIGAVSYTHLTLPTIYSV